MGQLLPFTRRTSMSTMRASAASPEPARPTGAAPGAPEASRIGPRTPSHPSPDHPSPDHPSPDHRGTDHRGTDQTAAEPLWRTAAGRELRAERQRQQRTLADVGDRAGVSVQYLSEVERGRKEPSSEVLHAVTGALGLRLVDLTARVTRRLAIVPARGRAVPARPTGPVALAA